MTKYENFLEDVQIKNNQLLSPENFKHIKISDSLNNKQKENCYESQKATIDFLANLKPENVEQYKNIRNEYIDCQTKSNLLNSL